MNKIQVITFGKLKTKEIATLVEYYQTLISKYKTIEIKSFKDPADRKIELKDFNYGGELIVLDDAGQKFNTSNFKSFITKKLEQNEQIVFLLGNAFGISGEVMQKAKGILSLSSLTLNHELALLVLMEQVFRILNIAAGGKYHK